MKAKSKQQLADELNTVRAEYEALYQDTHKKVGRLLYAFSSAIQIVNEVYTGQRNTADINDVLALVVMLFFANVQEYAGLDLTATIAGTDNMGFDEVTVIAIAQKLPLFRKTLEMRKAGASDAQIIDYIRQWHKDGTPEQ